MSAQSQVTVMTAADDSQQHYVTDCAAASGHRTGRYQTVCGCEILAASLTAPDGYACPSCVSWASGRPS